jgi:AcrR family transcriptional regulator
MRTTPRSLQPTSRRRTGGRSARVVHDVLEATVDALAATGYSGFSFEDVAARAGVSRTTIYRRWPTKQDLVRAALLRFAEACPIIGDTGSLRGDLQQNLRTLHDPEHAARQAGLLRALMADFDDPELVALARLVRERMRQPAVAAVERAIARGELPPGTDPDVVIEPAAFTVVMRQAIFGDRIDPEYGERLLDVILAGARAGAGVKR